MTPEERHNQSVESKARWICKLIEALPEFTATGAKFVECCYQPMTAIEYDYTNPEHYDGVSEWKCEFCGKRVGRWSGKELEQGEYEPRPR